MTSDGAFAGTKRFHLLRRIGEGGMGVVYEAEDRERQQRVALKTFHHADSDTIYRLKQEFRALAQVSHPNLAALYDLVVEGDSCFFTMELLDGADFITHCALEPSRELGAIAFAKTEITDSELLAGSLPVTATAPLAPTGPLPLACDERRLRAALPQLGLGLHALHQAGKIHRDIKPSNVQVTAAGRVVLLDFGLVADLDARRDHSAGIVGTVPYMAPEQAAGERRLGPAADWYAVGAMLYQALTGRLPFEGTPVQVLQSKQEHTPPPPRSLVPTIAADLDELCVDLLARDARARPVGLAALRRMGVRSQDPVLTAAHTVSISRETALAGRAAELAELNACADAVSPGRAAAAMIRGASGIGKSSLTRRFLDDLRARDPETLVLAGRCYEHETVPYRAMDSLIDELSNHWCQLGAAEARAILPDDAALLPTLFPVLGRVPAIADAPRARAAPDTQEVRTRAFAALRQVLRSLAERHPLVLVLDDMQWVDGDTGTLLADVMRAPDPPPLLLLLCTRPEGSEAVWPLVKRAHAEQRLIEVRPLSDEAAIALASAHLGAGAGTPELAARLAREAAGNPFFLLELVSDVQARGLDQPSPGRGLDAVLGERIDALGEQARAVAEVVAVAGEPIALRTAGAAAGCTPEELRRQLSLLRAKRVVRAAGGRADDVVEPYHDRVREALLALLPDDRRARHHRMIASALAGQASHERLARHWHGAGEPERAATHAWRAAEEAQTTLDFDRAAGLYRMALELGKWDEVKMRALRVALAGALSDSGRPVDAAREFAHAAEATTAGEALELRRRAADALLRGGYVEEGMAATTEVLRAFGLRLAPSPQRALMALLARRAWLRLRGLGWKARPLSSITQEELTRVDVLEGVALGLTMVDPFRSGEYAVRFVLAALELGEPRRVARALAIEADVLASGGQKGRALRLGEELARLIGPEPGPQEQVRLLTTQGMFDFLCTNQFGHARARLEQACDLYRTHERRSSFELNLVGLFVCWAQQYLGDLRGLAQRVPAQVEAAERAGDRFAACSLRTAFPIVHLVRDAPDEAADDVDGALRAWSTRPEFHMLHMFAMVAHADLALYRGQPERGRERLAADRAGYRGSLLHLLPSNAMLVETAAGRLALARAAQTSPGTSERRQAVHEVRALARKVPRIKVPAGKVFSQILVAGALSLEGDSDGCVAVLRPTILALEQLELVYYAQPLRRRLGEIIGGDEGRALCAGADAWMAGQGVKNPTRLVAMLAPGYA